MPGSDLADSPCLAVRAMPGQVPKLGSWLAEWHKCHCQRAASLPPPPITLVRSVVKEDGSPVFRCKPWSFEGFPAGSATVWFKQRMPCGEGHRPVALKVWPG